MNAQPGFSWDQTDNHVHEREQAIMSHKVDDAATATAMQDHSEHTPSHAALDAHDGHEPSGHGDRGRHGAGPGKHAGHHVEMFRLRFFGACC